MSAPANNLRSPLGRARGLGSAKDGLHHWWVQRLTALALIPLTVWFVASIIGLVGMGYDGFVTWLASPLHSAAMVVFLTVTFHHAQLGAQVVVEDYVASHARRVATVIAVKFICYGLAVLSVVSTLIVTFGV
jgi:succinate dehydrogenase / fumarate reductase membrane anchor subunit